VGNVAQSYPDRGNSGPEQLSVLCLHMNRVYSAVMGGIVVSSSLPCLLQWRMW
jgi:hypothetical protein